MTTATNEMQTVRQMLALKRAIDQRLNPLVRRATNLVTNSQIAATSNKMQKNQFDNVLAVATETGSVEVVKNFIRYQIGRKDDRGWRDGGFGLGLVGEIDGWLAEQAQEIGRAQEGVDADVAWIELVRLYIGYLRRDWVFQRSIASTGSTTPALATPPAAAKEQQP